MLTQANPNIDNPEVKPLVFNRAQLRLIGSGAKRAVFNGPRGTGKSSAIAWIMHMIVTRTPRSAWGLLGSTYMQILTRTLPSTVASLERIGYIKDVHFFVGRQAPKGLKWQMPYEPPLRSDHFIQFYNGTGFHLISQDRGAGAARGLNLDGVVSDEALLLDKLRYDEEVAPTIRANRRRFESVPFHHGEFHFTSMPTGSEGRWILESGNYYDDDGHDFLFLRNEIVKLQLKFLDEPSPDARMRTWRQLQGLEKECRFYTATRGPHRGLLYMEASAFDNIANLGLEYYRKQRVNAMSEQLFLTEVMGKRPQKVEGGFYPYLDDRHRYTAFDNDYLTGLEYDPDRIASLDCRADRDRVSGRPLWIAADWGANINCLSVAQTRDEGLWIINALHVKRPLILDDLAREFCRYYESHFCKEAFFVYDHTGNTAVANSKLTYAEQFADILRKSGWTVHMMTRGAAPTHSEKYMLWSRLLKEDNPNFPVVRINRHHCRNLLTSMDNAPARDGKNGIEKVKSSERSESLPQEEATHFSDTADLLTWHLYGHLLYEEIPFLGNVTR